MQIRDVTTSYRTYHSPLHFYMTIHAQPPLCGLTAKQIAPAAAMALPARASAALPNRTIPLSAPLIMCTSNANCSPAHIASLTRALSPPAQVPRLSGMLRSLAPEGGQLDVGALFLQRKAALEARRQQAAQKEARALCMQAPLHALPPFPMPMFHCAC
jgi:hypothetical protein